MAKTAKAKALEGKSVANSAKTRLLLAVCRDKNCQVKVRIAQKWVKNGLVPHCSCGKGEFLVQNRDFV